MATVLCVEDEAQIRSQIVAELNDRGYTTIEAANGKEGVQAVINYQPNLVLCDITMPEMSGFEMLATLRQNYPQFDRIPFVFLSALADLEDVVRGKKMGGDDYVTKPIDFTDLLSTLEARLSQVARIEKRNEADKEEMRLAILRNLQHELRTPLNHVIGFSQLLMNGTLGPMGSERQREYVASIHTSGCDLLDLIDDGLDLMDIISGSLSPQYDWCDMAALLSACIAEVGESADQREIRFAVEIHPSIPRMQTDQRLLTRAILAVLSNAIKFSQTGERVRVEAKFSSKNGIRISIADRGAGIAEHDLARVFKAFEQADTSMTREHLGAGLGLTLSKVIMEALGGGIELRSKLGAGTAVDLYLPINPGKTLRAA